MQVGPRSADTAIPAASGGGVDPLVALAAAASGAVALALGGVAIARRRRRAQPVWNIPDPATPSVDRGPVLVAIENALAAGGPAVVRAADGRAGLGVTTALALLTLFAWLSPEPVPQGLLAEHPDQLPPTLAGHDRSQLTATLARRGLIRVDEQGVQLHRVPAAHLVHRTGDERPGGARWATWAVRLLHAAVPPDPTDPTSWPAWRRLIPHVLAATDPGRPLDDVAVEVGSLLRAAAVFLQARGEQQSARALLEDAHDLYRRKLGRDHAQTRSAARALADNLSALGHPDHARRVLEDARADGAGPR